MAAPAISPNGGTISDHDEITITTTTTGATIYYTTDGSDPTTASPVYAEPLTLADDATVKAMAVKSGMNDSLIASAAFIVTITQTVNTPVISPVGGNISDLDEITITTSTTGATIYYTTDGSKPTTASPVYAGPLTLADDATVKAMAVKSGMNDSLIASAAFIVTITQTVNTPVISPVGGNISDLDEITITTSTTGATIYYTTDGSKPTTASPVYAGPLTLADDATVKAMAVKSGMNDSLIASAAFIVTITQTVGTPVISPAGGNISDLDEITITTTTDAATIYYTTDGSTPTTASPVYSGSFTLTASATVKTMAVAAGYLDSAVASATFTITSGGGGGGQPYGSIPWTLPGTIEAEDYDLGSQGVGYYDQTAGNSGAQYRTDDVDIWYSDAEGYYTGANATGEWLTYTVDVDTSGEYQLDFRVATPKSGRQLRVALDGADITGLITLPNTGGWQVWRTVSTTATLTAGQHVLRISVVLGGLNFSWVDCYETGGHAHGGHPHHFSRRWQHQ